MDDIDFIELAACIPPGEYAIPVAQGDGRSMIMDGTVRQVDLPNNRLTSIN